MSNYDFKIGDKVQLDLTWINGGLASAISNKFKLKHLSEVMIIKDIIETTDEDESSDEDTYFSIEIIHNGITMDYDEDYFQKAIIKRNHLPKWL